MGKSRSLPLGAWSLAFGAAVVVTPVTAVAAEPLQPNAAGWVDIEVDGQILKGDSTDPLAPVYQGWTNLSSFQLQTSSVNGAPPQPTSIKLQRTVTLGDAGFKIPMGKKPNFVIVRLRKAASGGSAEWLNVTLSNPTVKVDEVRTSAGASTGTEIIEVTFSSLEARLATQTAQAMTPYAQAPAWYDLLTNFRLDPPLVIGPRPVQGIPAGKL